MSKHKSLNKIKVKWLIPSLLLITNFSLVTANLFFTIERELDHIKQQYADRLNRSLTRVQHTVEYALKKNHQEWVQKEISAHGSDPELIEDTAFNFKRKSNKFC